MKILERLLVAFALCWVPAHAGTISYSDSGTFSASTPTTTFSGPGETWAFSFQVDSSPGVSIFQLGIAFSPLFSNFSYTLNGSPVAVTPTSLSFFNAAFGGGLDSYAFIRKQEYFNKSQAASSSWMTLRMDASAL